MERTPITQAYRPITLILIGLTWLLANNALASEKVYWLFLKDKGISETGALDRALTEAEASLTDRAGSRRAKLNRSNLVDEFDIPVNTGYVSAVEEFSGVTIRTRSRWLNAISLSAPPSTIEELAKLSFVKGISLARFSRIDKPSEPDLHFPVGLPNPHRDHNLDYGTSLRQNAFMNIPELHDRGYLGEGVLVGVCDAGFDNLDHDCFGELRIEAAWDFVNNDDNVANENDQGNGQHGTRTLSVMAGFDDGHLIGISPRASFVLAKTENTEEEVQVEEDYWVAAVEWMDSLGVDVISSSLGYIDWYQFEDLDGETAITTIAANRAVEVGMVVVNSMGNSGQNNYPDDKLLTPADGFDVFAIGALNRDSTLAGFSSVGPTYDGRIKPDFVTFGSSVVVASSINDDGYAAAGGTSFSAPAVAGLCALLIEASPYLTPLTLKELLQNSSDRGESPDTLFGWGIPNALTALEKIELIEVELLIPLHPGWNTISHNLVNLPVKPFPETLSELVENDHLAFAKDGHGRFYAPRFPFNNIPFWNPEEGYQLNLDETDTLIFNGNLVNYTSPIDLRAGWQIVAYFPNFEMIVEDAMTNLTNQNVLTMVKDESGKFYYPLHNFSNMNPLIPGRGYHIKLSEDANLVYPRVRLNARHRATTMSPTHFATPMPDKSGMSVLLLAGEGIESGDEVAFVDENGSLVGSGIFDAGKCGIALWGGKVAKSMPELMIWKRTTQQIVTPVMEWVEGDRGYQSDGISVFSVKIDTPQTSELYVTTFPTPFNDRLTVNINQPGASVYRLYDLTGKLVTEGKFQSNHSSASINAHEFGAGVYLLKVISPTANATLKIVCLK